MEIRVAPQRMLFIPDALSFEQAKKISWEKKITAFGALTHITSFLSRPKDEDFRLKYSEHRYQPFWHVAVNARYVYERNAQYQVPASGAEVGAVTHNGTRFEVTNGHFHIPVTEHCKQEESEEVFVDGVNGKANPLLHTYLSHSPKIVKRAIEKEVPPKSIVVPPQSRVSALMRDSLSKMIKGIQADTILEEHVEVTCVDLYYHPVYAFQYTWVPKGKDAIVEVDGLTGEVSTGSRVFSEYIGNVLDPNFLFDVGADAAGLLIPGGSIAVKVAKKYIDSKKKA